MKFIRPFYFGEFKCTGGECKDTCCHGWNIFIDDKSYQKYLNAEGRFGEKLRESIICGKNIQFKLNEKGDCPVLNKEGLCDVYINLGEESMCDVCKTYPRMQRKYYDVVENDLSLSCPEVARLLVMLKEPFDFAFGENEDIPEETVEISKLHLFNSLIAGRSISVEIMQNDSFPLWIRLYLCFSMAEKIQTQIEEKEFDKIKNLISVFQREEYLLTMTEFLNEIPENISLKLMHIRTLLKIIIGLNISNEKFKEFLIETVSFFENYQDSQFEEKYATLLNKFEVYMNNNKAFENYAVYYLFHYYMAAYNDENILKYITIMAEAYSLMKLFAMVRWINNEYILSDEEIIDVLYSYSRFIEHGSNIMSDLYNELKKEELNSMEYLIALIR